MWEEEYNFLLNEQEKQREQDEMERYLEWMDQRSEYEEGYWDCLECSAPREFLEDTPQ